MTVPIIRTLLIKLTSTCNLNCSYCYWFKDESVLHQPNLLTQEAENMLLTRLQQHIEDYELDRFNIILHGGEPLLFGKKRFIHLITKIEEIGISTNCQFTFGLTTNGVLIDEDWAYIFKVLNVSVTVSVDGTKDVHDLNRVDHKGNGSYDRTVKGISILKANGHEPTVLAVCNPLSDPSDVLDHLVNVLNLKYFDILIPQATLEEKPDSISRYYKKLFDLWYRIYSKRGVNIRLPRAMVKGLLGGNTQLDSIGYGPVTTLTVLPDGKLEPLDVLRIAGNGFTKTSISLFENNLQDIALDPLWKEAFDASLNLHLKCHNCSFKHACGGGYLPNRWSNTGRFDNPSVYCADLQEIFRYISEAISRDLSLKLKVSSYR